MIKRIVIRNKSRSGLGVMLEPWTDREDIDDGKDIIVEGDFLDTELVIDVGEDNFLSIWAPPGASIRSA